MILLTLPLFFIALIFALVYLIRGILLAIKKNPAKPMFVRMFIALGAALVLLIGSINLTSKNDDNKVSNEPKKEVANTETDTENETEAELKEESDSENSEIDKTEAEETVEEVEEEDKTEDEEKEEVLHIDDYIDLTDELINSIQRKPDDYFGESYKFTGRVIQVLEGDDGNIYRVSINDDYDNLALVTLTIPLLLEERILEDDLITFYATYHGITQYETTSGGKVSAMLFDISRSAHLLERIEE